MILTLEGHIGSVRAVAVLPDGKRAVSGSDDNTLKVWDLEGGDVIHAKVSYQFKWPSYNVVVTRQHFISEVVHPYLKTISRRI